jgi:hypothetical protein
MTASIGRRAVLDGNQSGTYEPPEGVPWSVAGGHRLGADRRAADSTRDLVGRSSRGDGSFGRWRRRRSGSLNQGGGAGAGGSIESMALFDRSSLDRRPGDRPAVGTQRSRSSPDEMTLATATGSVPRPRTIARPPPARRRPTRRARRERPVRGSARASGRRSSRFRTAGPASFRVRGSPPSSPRRPGSHPTKARGQVQGVNRARFCAFDSRSAALDLWAARPGRRG